MVVAKSLVWFLLAGVLEIGGGWLVWQWLREDRGGMWGLIGGLTLFLYGVIPTLQPAHFSRTYAAYGGVFIILSLAWGFFVDGDVPDRPDLIGGALSLAGAAVMMWWPR